MAFHYSPCRGALKSNVFVESLSPFGLDTAFSALFTSLNCPAAICALTAATRLPQHHIILPTCLRAIVWPVDAKLVLFLFCTWSQSLCWIVNHKSAESLTGERPQCSPGKWDAMSLSPHQDISFGQSPAMPLVALTRPDTGPVHQKSWASNDLAVWALGTKTSEPEVVEKILIYSKRYGLRQQWLICLDIPSTFILGQWSRHLQQGGFHLPSELERHQQHSL